MDAQRSALVVASYEYEDARLRRLRAPARDADELARVLGDASIGDFDVKVSVNEPEHVVRRKLAAFFQNRGLDDLLLLHLSCHGLKDDDGHLYFATADTEVAHLDATSIPSEFVNRQMNRSRSRRIVLLLDCCYSGAFASGMLSRAGDRVDIKERFDGRGRVVLTASSAMEYSFEGDELTGAANPSVFTSALVRGLESGKADRDRDGWISVEELYDYAYDEVRAVTPSQTPGKWTFDVQGDLYLARSSLTPVAEPVELPAELRSAIQSPFSHVRAGAVEELAGLARGTEAGLAEAAREALDELAGDDSRRVSDAAARVLAEPTRGEATVAAVQEPPAEAAAPAVTPEPQALPEPPPPAVPAEPRVPGLVAALSLVGAVGLLPAIAIPISNSTDERWNVFAVLSPLEAVAVALAVASIGVALFKEQVYSSLAAGLLVGFGLMTSVASFSLLSFALRRLETGGTLVPVVVVLGAIAILAAGLVCARPLLGVRAVGRVHPAAFWLGLAGAVVFFAALFRNYDGASSLIDELAEGVSAEFFVEPGFAVAFTVVALVVMGSLSRPLAAGLLLAVGLQAALHYVGLIIAALMAVGAGPEEEKAKGFLGLPDEVEAGGFIGLLGALLVVAAGVVALRALSARPSNRT